MLKKSLGGGHPNPSPFVQEELRPFTVLYRNNCGQVVSNKIFKKRQFGEVNSCLYHEEPHIAAEI